MSYQVLLDGVDVSSKVLKISIKHDDAWQGRLSANEASFELDNTDNAYTLSNLDIEGQTVDIYLNGLKKFTGYAQKPRLNLRTKTVKVVAKDEMINLMKKKCQDKVFVNTSLDTILLWLVETVGGITSYSLESTGKTVGFASYSLTDKLIDRLQEIVDSVGGQMYFDETGKLIFKAGFLSPFSTSTVGTLTVSKLSDLDFEFIPSKGNKVTVSSKSREVSAEKEYIFTWSGTVPAEGMPDGKDDDGNTLANEQWKAQFDNPAIDVDSYSEVEWEADVDLELDQTTYDANFSGGSLKYPDFMFLKINNSATAERIVTKLGIKGKPIKSSGVEAVYQIGAGDVERRVTNDIVSGKKWAAQLAQWLCEEGNNKWQVSIPIADFDFAVGLSVGDKITLTETSTGLNHRVVVRSIDLKYPESASITVINDRASTFSYSPSSTDMTTSENSDTESIKGDGFAPASPQWDTTPLETFFSNGKTYIKVNWVANSEDDLKGYEVAWSYDSTNWYNSGLTSETSLTIEVKSGVTVYVKVRAKDMENLSSDWNTVQSITSANDTTIPANLSSITATGGFDLIYVSWAHSKPSDFSHYIVQRATDASYYSTWTEVAVVQSKEYIDTNVVEGTYYKYRVKAVDIYGNQATNWITTSTGVTCISVQGELDDLQSQITANDGELSALNTDLSNLQTQVNNLDFSDLGGNILQTQISDDTIISPMIAANQIKTLHMDVDEIVGNTAWFGKITADHIGANQITTNHLNVDEITSNSAWFEKVTTNHIAANAVTANEIAAGTITTNELEATMNLRAGQSIQVGSLVKMGYGVMSGDRDGFIVGNESGAHLLYDGSTFELKEAVLEISSTAGSIVFADAKIELLDKGLFNQVYYIEENFTGDNGSYSDKVTESAYHFYSDYGLTYFEKILDHPGENEHASKLAIQMVAARKYTADNDHGSTDFVSLDAIINWNDSSGVFRSDTGIMSIVPRSYSEDSDVYFRFNRPINVLYSSGRDAPNMPPGTILVQGNRLYYRDEDGDWHRAAVYDATPE